METFQYLDLVDGRVKWEQISSRAFQSNPHYLQYGITRNMILRYFDKLGKGKSKCGFEEDMIRLYSGKKVAEYGINSVEDTLFVLRSLRKEMKEVGLIKATNVENTKEKLECLWCNSGHTTTTIYGVEVKKKNDIIMCGECERYGCTINKHIIENRSGCGFGKCWSCLKITPLPLLF